MSIFQSFANFILRKKKNAENKDEKINMNDLRIVKLYVNLENDHDELGRVIGIERARARTTFALVQKFGGIYVTIPTKSDGEQIVLTDNSTELHDIVIKKTRRNNRYRKPAHLCSELEGKKITKEQASTFAEMLDKITCDTNYSAVSQQEQALKDVCKKFSDMLKSTNTKKVEDEKEMTL